VILYLRGKLYWQMSRHLLCFLPRLAHHQCTLRLEKISLFFISATFIYEMNSIYQWDNGWRELIIKVQAMLDNDKTHFFSHVCEVTDTIRIIELRSVGHDACDVIVCGLVGDDHHWETQSRSISLYKASSPISHKIDRIIDFALTSSN
jgi:hypothetical protein